MVKLFDLEIQTKGENDIVDITEKISELVLKSGITAGSVLIFVPGATGALSTIEYEPGLLKDFPDFMEKIIPEKKHYCHNETWHDYNGHAHLRATLLGPSLTVPVGKQKLILGSWQQIVFFEFDNKPHFRRLKIQISGE